MFAAENNKDCELLDVLPSIRFHTSLDQACQLLTADVPRSLRQMLKGQPFDAGLPDLAPPHSFRGTVVTALHTQGDRLHITEAKKCKLP
jgi:hypothetical protein